MNTRAVKDGCTRYRGYEIKQSHSLNLLEEGLGFSTTRFVAQAEPVSDGNKASTTCTFTTAVTSCVSDGVETHGLGVINFVLVVKSTCYSCKNSG